MQETEVTEWPREWGAVVTGTESCSKCPASLKQSYGDEDGLESHFKVELTGLGNQLMWEGLPVVT